MTLVVGLGEDGAGACRVADDGTLSRVSTAQALEPLSYGRDVSVASLRLAGRPLRRAIRRSAARFLDVEAMVGPAIGAVEQRAQGREGHPLSSYVPPHELDAVVLAVPPFEAKKERLLSSLAASYLFDAEDNLVSFGGELVRAEFKMDASVTERVGARGAFKFCSIPKEVRSTLKPKREGWEIVSLDMNAADCRSVVSLDPRLSARYGHDPDFHKRTAELVFGSRSDGARKIAKGTFNAIAYGASVEAAAGSTGLSVDRMAKCFDLFRERLPELDGVRQEIAALSKLEHSSGTIEVEGAHPGARLARVAQTISSRAFLGIVAWVGDFVERRPGIQVLFTVNDELVLECDVGAIDGLVEAAESGASAISGFENVVRLEHGPSYGEMETWTT